MKSTILILVLTFFLLTHRTNRADGSVNLVLPTEEVRKLLGKPDFKSIVEKEEYLLHSNVTGVSSNIAT
jgi:hypothetical protein